jgi:hypothetical protein
MPLRHIMGPDQGQNVAFLADSDQAIHQWLSLHGHQFARHPVLEALTHRRCRPASVSWAWRRRRSVLDNFLLLLERTRTLALQEGRVELARAIHVNLADEYGLDPDSGQPTGHGSHREWARWLIEALDALDPPLRAVLRPGEEGRRWNYLPCSDEDGLDVLAGMCLAHEICIPIEFQAFLNALEIAFPQLCGADHPRAHHYLQDHIVHDERRHLPDLVDGVLGWPPGSLHARIEVSAELETRSLELARGVERVLAMRLRFYDQMAADAQALALVS